MWYSVVSLAVNFAIEKPLPPTSVKTLPMMTSSCVPEMKSRRGRCHLREHVPLEVEVVGVRDLHAGGRPPHGLLVVRGRRQVVLTRLAIEKTILARPHVRRMRERQSPEPQVPGLVRCAGPGDGDNRLHHRRDDRGRAHVLAGARLVVENLRNLVEVPLAGLVEELVGVLEVVHVPA